jgi:two-component system chemotaxis response regulator CheB
MLPSVPVAADIATRPIRVMVVDDSLVIRGVISRILKNHPELEVTASASNGRLAVDRARRGGIDVIVLDIEMPEMDGLTALPKLLEIDPTFMVIMASTLTLRNADISIRALNAGAADYLPKPTATAEIGGASDFARELVEKIKTLGHRRIQVHEKSSADTRPKTPGAIVLRKPSQMPPRILAVGSSTGGPQALSRLFSHLRGGITVPAVITQHMPPKFTEFLATHIAKETGLPCREASNGELLTPGHVLIAPGDYHLTLARSGASVSVVLNQQLRENFCRPSVDPMLRSISSLYGASSLAVILTGMGSDGQRGCETLVSAGGTVMAQDEASSVVWGMPGAVARAGVCSSILPIDVLGQRLAAMIGQR